MFPRYFFTFCIAALFAVIISVNAAEPEELKVDLDLGEFDLDDSALESVESRSSLGKKVLKILKKFFEHATEDCLKAAVSKCKKHWYNPSKVIQCAKDFWSIENAACLVGA